MSGDNKIENENRRFFIKALVAGAVTLASGRLAHAEDPFIVPDAALNGPLSSIESPAESGNAEVVRQEHRAFSLDRVRLQGDEGATLQTLVHDGDPPFVIKSVPL